MFAMIFAIVFAISFACMQYLGLLVFKGAPFGALKLQHNAINILLNVKVYIFVIIGLVLNNNKKVYKVYKLY